jgi:hypothetical protein
MSQIISYIQYFQRIANEHKDIHDFFICDINEPLAALKTGILYPALIMNNTVGKFTGPNQDDLLDEISGGFLIIENLSEIDDFPNEMLTLDKMKQIGEDIISRILHDTNKCEELASKAFPGFDIHTVSYEMMGPLFENCWGFNFTFKLQKILSLGYDASKWDETKENAGRHVY